MSPRTMVLGVAVGGREDDSRSPAPISVARCELRAHAVRIRRTWSGSDASSGAAQPGHRARRQRPAPAPARRRADRARPERAECDDKPHTIALAYYSLGDEAQPNAEAYLGDYYAFLGDMAGQISGGAAKDPQTAKGYAEGFEAVGCDELIMFPSSSDPDQVDMLAEAVL